MDTTIDLSKLSDEELTKLHSEVAPYKSLIERMAEEQHIRYQNELVEKQRKILKPYIKIAENLGVDCRFVYKQHSNRNLYSLYNPYTCVEYNNGELVFNRGSFAEGMQLSSRCLSGDENYALKEWKGEIKNTISRIIDMSQIILCVAERGCTLSYSGNGVIQTIRYAWISKTKKKNKDHKH